VAVENADNEMTQRDPATPPSRAAARRSTRTTGFGRHARALRRRLARATGNRRRTAAATHDDVTIQRARTIIAHNESPDIPFTQSINRTRAASTAASMLRAAFARVPRPVAPARLRDEAYAKPDAAALLRTELAKPGYRCEPTRSAPIPIRTSRSSANGR
jgi:hypothetical protein